MTTTAVPVASKSLAEARTTVDRAIRTLAGRWARAGRSGTVVARGWAEEAEKDVVLALDALVYAAHADMVEPVAAVIAQHLSELRAAFDQGKP